MIIRATQYGISSQLLALLSGYGGGGLGGSKPDNRKIIDASEEELLNQK